MDRRNDSTEGRARLLAVTPWDDDRATSDLRDAPARSVKAAQAAAQTSTLQHLCRFDGEIFLNIVPSTITNLRIRGSKIRFAAEETSEGGDMTLGYLAAGPVVVGGASTTTALFSPGFAIEPCCQSSAQSQAQSTASRTADTAKKKSDPPPPGLPPLHLLPLTFCPARRSNQSSHQRKDCPMHDATHSDALLAVRSGRDASHSAFPHEAAVCRGRTLSVLAALLALAACAAPIEPVAVEPPDLTERLAAIAAPHQDLQAVRLRPEDGCYWYAHVGPVETTMLPLRTVDGRPICEPRQIPALAAG